MFYLKSFPPNYPVTTWTYNRFGQEIPSKEIQIEKLKDYFVGSPLGEEKIEELLRKDLRIFIETEKERELRLTKEKEENEIKPEVKLEKKTIENERKEKLKKEINKFNEEKEKALETENKEDDKLIEKKEKELMDEINKEGGL